VRAAFTGSKNSMSVYLIEDITVDGKRSTKTVRSLGTAESLMKEHNLPDLQALKEWARDYARKESNKAKGLPENIVKVSFHPDEFIESNVCRLFNVSYLFLQKVYYDLGLPDFCRKISKNYKFEYNLSDIMSRLIYGRVLFPASKLKTYKNSMKLIEQPTFSEEDIYRSLDVIYANFAELQAYLYQKSSKLVKRNTGVLYYDCTNFFFEMDFETDFCKNGPSKESRPTPIVQMGMFMDATGFPLCICVDKGNQAEVNTMIPLEKKILSDFELSKFVVCSDAALAAEQNRKFNNKQGRAFVTTLGLKRNLKQEWRDWMLDPAGWHLECERRINGDIARDEERDADGKPVLYDISKIEYDDKGNYSEQKHDYYYHRTFFKELYVEGCDKSNGDPFNQTIIVTFSLKYRDFLRAKRAQQMERAERAIKTPSKIEKRNVNDYRRYISRSSTTAKGDVATKNHYEINQQAVDADAVLDGYYAVATNLLDDVPAVLEVMHYRWRIEYLFRMLKSGFNSRPAYVWTEAHIKAHFLLCFVALLLYMILERKVIDLLPEGSDVSFDKIIDTLREMYVLKLDDSNGYVPTYTRTAITDALHEYAGFRTDHKLITEKQMKVLCNKSRKYKP